MAEDDNVHDFTVDILRKIQADIAVFRHDVIERLDKTDASVSQLQTAIARAGAGLVRVRGRGRVFRPFTRWNRAADPAPNRRSLHYITVSRP